jgi:hypothetical protein
LGLSIELENDLGDLGDAGERRSAELAGGLGLDPLRGLARQLGHESDLIALGPRLA